MKTKTILPALIFLLSVLCLPIRAEEKHLGDTLTEFVITYLRPGRTLIGEGIWDPATGAPNVAELQKRIQTLETSLGGGLPPLKTLANSIRKGLTSDDYEKSVGAIESSLVKLLSDEKRRLQVTHRPPNGGAPPDGTLTVRSYWDYNGSVSGMLIAGNRQIIVCIKPAKDLEGVIAPGTVLFAGQQTNRPDGTSGLAGVARLFAKGRAPVDFLAGGPAAASSYILRGTPTIKNPDGSAATSEHLITLTAM